MGKEIGPRIAIDSMVLTYFIEASLAVDPSAESMPLAMEKILTYRLYLYRDETYYIMPIVKSECAQINNTEWRKEHEGYWGSLFFDYPFQIEQHLLDQRIKEYLRWHPKQNDCRLVAEAEIGDDRFGCMDILLTNDTDLIKSLKSRTHKISLMKPSEYWNTLKVPKGSRPKKVPHHSNPLSEKTWWKW